jgi:DNA-binding XRE family transcriptional regulator
MWPSVLNQADMLTRAVGGSAEIRRARRVSKAVDESQSFGLLLRQHRLAASLSQEVLAERAGLSVNAIAALERGRSTAPRPATVLLLAEGPRPAQP